MRMMNVALVLLATLYLCGGRARAQSTTGTIRRHVNDAQRQDVSNNHQSGSDYRIYNTGTIINGTGESASIYPVELGDGSTFIQWNPIPLNSEGLNFRTYSAFRNDDWRVNSRLTANLGVRKNSGRDQQGTLVASDSTFSPRIGLVLDPLGDQKWSVTGSVAQYVAALNNAIGDSASGAGNPQTFRFAYFGPSINANAAGPLTPTPQAIRQIVDWYFANGADTLPFLSQPDVPGVTPQIRGNLKSPNVLEYAGGINRQFGNRAALRADFVYRHYRDFYAERTDTSAGQVKGVNWNYGPNFGKALNRFAYTTPRMFRINFGVRF